MNFCLNLRSLQSEIELRKVPASYRVDLVHGLNVSLLLDFLFANSVSQFFAIDLVVSSLIFLFWSYRDSRRENVNGWWGMLIANCCVGLSLALPLSLGLIRLLPTPMKCAAFPKAHMSWRISSKTGTNFFLRKGRRFGLESLRQKIIKRGRLFLFIQSTLTGHCKRVLISIRVCPQDWLEQFLFNF